MTDRKPTIGCIVIYRTDGRNGLSYDLPAMINCTRDTHPGDYPDGQKNPLPVPESDAHVHFTVFSPGGFGTQITTGDSLDLPRPHLPQSSQEFKGGRDMIPGSGTYVELNVAEDKNWPSGPTLRSWRWPTIS